MASHASRRFPVRSLLIGALLAGLAGCAQPATVMAPVPAGTPVVAGRRIVLTIGFNFDSARILPEFYATLDNLAAGITDPSLVGVPLDINGHTDVIGRLGYNIALSRLRAQAVVDYLVSRGVPRENLHAQGFGPLQLLDPSNPASPANRRVEVVATQ